MKRNTISALLGLALVAAPAAHAEEGLSYSYVEFRGVYTQVDILGPSDLTINANGLGVAGSLAFGDTGLFAMGSFDTVSNDIVDDIEIDLDRASLGLGYAMPVSDELHLLVEAKALRLKASADGGSESENGYQAAFGVRGMLSDTFEASLKGGVIKVDNAELEAYDGGIVEIGARYHMDGFWSVGLDTSFTKDERNAMLGLRGQW
jgi:hypothetical protein